MSEVAYMLVRREDEPASLEDFGAKSSGRYVYQFFLRRPTIPPGVSAQVIEVPVPLSAEQMVRQKRYEIGERLLGSTQIHISADNPGKLLYQLLHPFDVFESMGEDGDALRGKGLATAFERAVAKHLNDNHPSATLQISPKLTDLGRAHFERLGLHAGQEEGIAEFHARLERFTSKPRG